MADPAVDSEPRRYIGYYRVSTRPQGRSGLGLEGQRIAVLDFLARNQPARMLAEFTEVESGRKDVADRPQLAAAIALCRKKKARLIVARIDRLGRNVALIARLMESKVDFVAADLPIADRMTIHIIAAVAEYEADLIASRRRDALASAQAKGKRLGFAAMTTQKRREIAELGVEAARTKRLEHVRRTMPHILELRRRGIRNYAPVAKALNAAGIPTFKRQGRWCRDTVRSVILTLEPDFKVTWPSMGKSRQREMLGLAMASVRARADARAMALAAVIAAIEAEGITSNPGIARALTHRGIATPMNAATWSDLTVRKVRERIRTLAASRAEAPR